MMLSESKTTLPGRKQVFRERHDGKCVRDVIGLMDESNLTGEPLLQKVMENGRRLQPAEALEICRARCKAQREALPESLMNLTKTGPEYPVVLSPALTRIKTAETHRHRDTTHS